MHMLLTLHPLVCIDPHPIAYPTQHTHAHTHTRTCTHTHMHTHAHHQSVRQPYLTTPYLILAPAVSMAISFPPCVCACVCVCVCVTGCADTVAYGCVRAQNAELASCFWYLLVEGLALYPLTWYLQQVLPNQFGVRRSPFFFLAPLGRLLRKPVDPAGNPEREREREWVLEEERQT
jgi:hypothetical protein